MTSSNGNIFRVTGPLCGEFTGPGESPTQRPVTRSFDVFFDLRLNKRLSKQPWGWWFEPPSWSLWRHRNDKIIRKPWKFWILIQWFRKSKKFLFYNIMWLLHPVLHFTVHYDCVFVLERTANRNLIKMVCRFVVEIVLDIPVSSNIQNVYKCYSTFWDDRMTPSNGNIFRVTGSLWGESTGDRWIFLTKASDMELWCFLRSAPE